jgi:putative MATE family efflux protein
MEEKELQQGAQPVAENKMGVMPVNKLLISMSVPMMLSMLVQALYNIVDSIFVARISEDALTAVSLAFPMQTLMVALAGGTGVGVNALLSKSLGEKDFKKANEAARNGIFLAVLSYLVFLFLGIFGVKLFYQAQTSDPEIIMHGTRYLTIVCCMSMGFFAQFIFDRLLQSTGKTFYTMITQMSGAVINLILDPIMIFGMFGFPRMESAGAALATVCGQIAAGTLACVFNLKKNEEIKVDFKGFRPSPQIIGAIYKVGVPSIIMQSIGSIMTFSMNQILIAFSSTATAVFGVYFKLQSFIFMPVFGLNNGMVPIIAYNYGAKNKSRMMKAYKLSLVFAVSIMTVGMMIFLLIPGVLFKLFDASEHMLSMGIPALRIICIHFPVAAFCIVTGTMFQALGKAVYSMVNSICRQLVVLLPAAFLLAQLGNVNFVWFAFPIAEVASAIITIVFLIRTKKNIFDKL